MSEKELTKEEERFCLIFVCGPSPYNGNAAKTYEFVFQQRRDIQMLGVGAFEVASALAAHELMKRPEIKERIAQLKNETKIDATTLAPRITSALLKIMDECSTSQVMNRFGETISPAAMRSVAVNAASKLMELHGIKEDIAHKVVLESEGDGITFNLIMPDSSKDNELSDFIN